VPPLADEIIDAIGRDVADYARPLEGPFGEAVRVGVERALGRFLDLIADPARESTRSRRIYVQLGAGELAEGRSLDALLSAYRLGARLAWRRFVEAGKGADVEPDVLYRLGEAIFAYIEGLSAESIEGYAEAQTLAAGERARARRHLVNLLLADPPADHRAIEAAAVIARWRVPETMAALVTEGQDPEALAARLGAESIAVDREGEVLAFVGDPDAPGRRAEIAAAVGDRRAALGPTVQWRDARSSAERAGLAHRLLEAGTLPGPLVAAEEHLVDLLLHVDARLAHDIAEAHLRALRDVSPGSRVKLERTLRAWLDHQGRIDPVAHELGIHAQTVRYRVNQLRELLGGALDDPGERLALSLALRVPAAQA
jgi:hypothetical protein